MRSKADMRCAGAGGAFDAERLVGIAIVIGAFAIAVGIGVGIWFGV